MIYMDILEELRTRLENVPDTYEEFVISGVMEAERDTSIAERVIEYIDNNPEATTSQIIQFETEEIFGIKPIS